MTERYAGKPFLKLVDSFVLDAIGALDVDAEAALVAMEPNLRGVYGASGGWREIVASQMNFPAGLAGAIREIWDKGRSRFVAEQGHEPDPLEFTRTFVDTNFAH